MFTPKPSRADALRRLGLLALILCTACLAIENAVLLSVAATFRPTAFFAAAAAAVKVGCALTVPLWLILIVGAADWSLPQWRDSDAGSDRRAAALEERHE